MSRPLAVIVRFTALGDVLLAGPVAQALAADHDVLFVTEPLYAPLVARLPGVSEVVALARNVGFAGAWKLGRSLAARRPKIVLDLQHKARSVVLTRAIGAPDTRSLWRRTPGQSLAWLAGRETVHHDRHQVERYLSLLPGSQANRLGPMHVPAEWKHAANQLAAGAGWQPGDRPFAVAPAATHATKGWPVEHYAALVRQSIPQNAPLLLVAGPSDTHDVDAFLTALGPWERLLDTSRAPLTTLAALLARSSVLVGNDSGPIHLATALDVPTVAVFGPTSHVRWGPLPGHDAQHLVARNGLDCSPCANHGGERCPQGHHRCMQELGVDGVRAQLVQLHAPRRRAGQG